MFFDLLNPAPLQSFLLNLLPRSFIHFNLRQGIVPVSLLLVLLFLYLLGLETLLNSSRISGDHHSLASALHSSSARSPSICTESKLPKRAASSAISI